MFEKFTLKPNASFLDVGSGNGIVNMVAGLIQPGLRKNIGVELHEGLVEKSKDFVKKTKYPYPIDFVREDFFRNPQLFSDIDVTYHYMNLNDEKGILLLLDQWKKNAKSGAVFILNDSEQNLNFYRSVKKVFLDVMTDKSYQNYDHFLYVFTKK
jgi:SAM-dependent methyltransferase